MAELTVEKFEQSMGSFAKIVKDGFDAVDKRFDGVERDVKILRHEMQEGFQHVEKEFQRVDNRIEKLSEHVDGFVHLHQKLDIELVALRSKYDHLAARVARLEGTPA